jgi:DNA excision repair protein ERCC-2
VRITCCDASELLKPCFDSFERLVAFSATLKPFEYYSRLSGLASESLVTDEFQSPFDPRRRKLLLIPQVSTKFSDRARSAPKIAEAMARIAALKPGNYFAFFPSFAFLEQVRGSFIPPDGFEVRSQERDMRPSDVQEMMEHLAEGLVPTIVFAVQGGVFSEGVDYPGDLIIGAFIVGPPLPSFDLEREEMRKFYQSRYGAGFDYAYAFPAMAKAIQAAGRVIRTETDRGLIVLLDGRFLEGAYSRSMPADWFTHSPRELVSSAILREVQEFWSSEEPKSED